MSSQLDLSSRVLERQAAQNTEHDKRSKDRTLKKDDQVYVCNFGNGPRWLPGTVMAVQGSRTFEIQLNDGRTVKRHLDHVHIRTNNVEDELPDYLSIDHQP